MKLQSRAPVATEFDVKERANRNKQKQTYTKKIKWDCNDVGSIDIMLSSIATTALLCASTNIRLQAYPLVAVKEPPPGP